MNEQRQCMDWTPTGAWRSRSDKLNGCQLGGQNMQRLRETLNGQIWYTFSLYRGSISESDIVDIINECDIENSAIVRVFLKHQTTKSLKIKFLN